MKTVNFIFENVDGEVLATSLSDEYYDLDRISASGSDAKEAWHNLKNELNRISGEYVKMEYVK